MGFLSAFQKKPLTDAAHSVEKFSSLLTSFLEKTGGDAGSRERTITLLAQSPAMAAARALALHSVEIDRRQIGVRVVFAKLAPVDMLVQFVAALKLVDPLDAGAAKIRFLKNAALMDAHEQLVLGKSVCWTGDMLRRSNDQRNRLDIVEEGQSGPVRLAELSFGAIWAAAKPVPGRVLNGQPLQQAYASVSPVFAAAGLAGEKAPGAGTGLPLHTRH